jgi:hypothetical protein
VLKDRFSSYVQMPFGTSSYYNQVVSVAQANGWMFVCSEDGVYATRDGVSFLKVLELGGGKVIGAAYGGGKYVLVGDNSQIYTSVGPAEYNNWNFQTQTPDEAEDGYAFFDVTFDGTAFVVVGINTSTLGLSIQRALPADVSSWSAITPGALPGDVIEANFYRVRVGGEVIVAVGAAVQDETYDRYDVIQRSTDHGVTWTNVTPPGAQPVGGSAGLTELEYAGDRFLALSSEEPGEGVLVRLLQSTDGASWENITDRLESPLFSQQQPNPTERVNRSALMHDNGRVVVLLPMFEMQIGKMGASGPVEFERVPFSSFVDAEAGMILFKGNYYLLVENELEVPAFLIAFTPRLPVVE